MVPCKNNGKAHFIGFWGYPYEIVHCEDLAEDHPIFDELIAGYKKEKEFEMFDFCPYCGVELIDGRAVK